jgi:hypothetical protein
LLSITGKSQNFDGLYQRLGKPTNEIIQSENSLMNDGILNNKLEDVCSTPNGGLYIVYSKSISDKYSETIYYFNKANLCFAFKEVQPIENLGEQLSYLSSDFLKKDEHTLYHKYLDFKVTYYTDIKSKLAIFIYAKKGTITPMN